MSALFAQSDAGDRLRVVLAGWARRGWLRQLDSAFADFLRREVPDAPPLLLLAAALVSHQLGRGHACLDLAATLADPAFALSLPPEGSSVAAADDVDAVYDPLPSPGELLAGVSLRQWQSALASPALVAGGIGDTPLVLVGTRLYLRRYWQYEGEVRAAIEQRLRASASLQAALPVDRLRAALARLFPRPSTAAAAADWQKLACALAARSAFSVITGGPGTGKTTTVVRLLALLQALALAEAPADEAERPLRALRIRLAAPTGKAAARLNESIAGAVASLPLFEIDHADAVRAAIPQQVTTLHRLLGSRPDSRHFRHHAGNPLALDVLVIDEASMIDLEMMACVLAALPAKARLILLGDKDQLASVEAGAVLGQLCQRAGDGHYTPLTAGWLQAVSGERIVPGLIDASGGALDQAVAMLRHSHRFAADSGIGRLADAVNRGDRVSLREIWKKAYSDLALLPLAGSDDAAFRSLLVDGGQAAVQSDLFASAGASPRGYRHYLEVLRRQRPADDAGPAAVDAWALAVVDAHRQFQVLCALRRGRFGVDGLNRLIARHLLAAGLIPASEGWYPGRPVLVTRNDYGLGLMNGDIGITLALPAERGGSGLRVAFPSADDGRPIKWVLPSRLQAVETVYALTVHKAQGSEFAHAALVLPDTLNPILTRELIYTAVTRARSRLTVACAGGTRVFEQAVARRVVRGSGLVEPPAGQPAGEAEARSR